MNEEGEISIDIDKSTMEQLKKAINHDELVAISERYKNGTETEDDLINYIQRFKIESDKYDLDVVQYKHYKKLLNLYNQEKEKNKKLDTIIRDMAFELTHYERWKRFDSDEVIECFKKTKTNCERSDSCEECLKKKEE